VLSANVLVPLPYPHFSYHFRFAVVAIKVLFHPVLLEKQYTLGWSTVQNLFFGKIGRRLPFPLKSFCLTACIWVGYAAPMKTGDLVQVVTSGSIGIIEKEYTYVYNQYVQIRILVDKDTDQTGRVIRIPLSYATAYWTVIA